MHGILIFYCIIKYKQIRFEKVILILNIQLKLINKKLK